MQYASSPGSPPPSAFSREIEETGDIGAAEVTRIMATITEETMATMTGTTTNIINPKQQGLSVVELCPKGWNGTRGVVWFWTHLFL